MRKLKYWFAGKERIQKDFVEALRSGEYKQTELTLYDKSTDSYCAVGVFGKVVTGNPENGYRVFRDVFGKPPCVVHNLNDNGYTFPAIADKIEDGLLIAK